ncbi:hypothetical protein AAEX37_01797 [Oligella sp. MSHR50489EDL]|uniref:hypothetical protein n=1 Tax=Oligella sp. MSHR50489EDL TaxID=3139409 RepID=UPI003D81A211
MLRALATYLFLFFVIDTMQHVSNIDVFSNLYFYLPVALILSALLTIITQYKIPAQLVIFIYVLVIVPNLNSLNAFIQNVFLLIIAFIAMLGHYWFSYLMKGLYYDDYKPASREINYHIKTNQTFNKKKDKEKVKEKQKEENEENDWDYGWKNAWDDDYFDNHRVGSIAFFYNPVYSNFPENAFYSDSSENIWNND